MLDSSLSEKKFVMNQNFNKNAEELNRDIQRDIAYYKKKILKKLKKN